MTEYRVRLADPHRHWFEVDCCVRSAGATEDFELPSWIPGSYLLREFSRHVVRVVAFSATGRSLNVEKIAHNVWRCDADGEAMTLRMTVYALDESVRGAWFDTRGAWFNGPCLFVRPINQPDGPAHVRLEEPPKHLSDWKVATAMAPVAIDAQGFGDYEANDYDELLDHPFVIGSIERIDFEVRGVPHALVVTGSQDGDLERVADDLQRICAAQIEFFGNRPPFDRYLFLCLVVADGYGGLEHRSSSTLMFSRSSLPAEDDERPSRNYQRMLSLASHEYFHTWHVKRSKPAAFMPYRLSERNYTRLLWVFEGITSYYQDRFLLRCGVIDHSAYLRRVAELIANVMRVPGRHVQSLADSSFDAWDRLYKPNANSVNAGVSYYTKGALAALALDLEIRLRHGSKMSLDDIIQTLWLEFGSKNIGLPEDGFESLVNRLAGSDYASFFQRAIRGTDDLPLSALLKEFAIDLKSEDTQASAWLGIVPRSTIGGIECAAVLDGGPAQSAGLNPRDIIVAVNRKKVTSENLSQVLDRFGAGSSVSLSYFRGDELLESTAELVVSPPNAYTLAKIDDPNAAQSALRDAWLSG